jgi:xylulose-5-phosphate/fructose-6-phosphate phosphoketolase
MDLPASTVAVPDLVRHLEVADGHGTLTPDELLRMNAYWRATNYLSVGQIYLYDNPLLREPLTLAHVKPLVVGHWGTTPGQKFIYLHLNRVIKSGDLDMIYVAGPGHGGPALVANTYLEGSYSEIYPNVSRDEAGLKRLFTQFSFPGGISSHVAPSTPGSIHEGGELGYSLSHAFGAAFDNPDLIVACIVGDGEAEAIAMIKRIQSDARAGEMTARPRWPMIVLRSPKGWTGPVAVDGLQIEGTFRSHQVPILVDAAHPDHVALLEDWMKSYKPEELFDQNGSLNADLAALAPEGERRMGANPHANGPRPTGSLSSRQL